MNPGFDIGNVHIGGRVLNARMTGVSDLPFRRAASKLGAAYVATEMVACELLARGRPDVVRRAAVGEGLPLMVVQLVGRDARWIAEGAAMAEAAGAHIIDLNMGCPAKEVSGKLSGSALMRDFDQAERLMGAAIGAVNVPVTLKMRLGWDDQSKNAPALAMLAESAGIKAITVHGRTRQQFYKGSADWRAVADVKAATRLPVIVNGDVTDAISARNALRQSRADAIMIGRGAYGRPWIAASIERALQNRCAKLVEPNLGERLSIALDHFRDSLAFYGDTLGLKIFRKHLGWYIQNAPRPLYTQARRAAKSKLCRLDQPSEVEAGLGLCGRISSTPPSGALKRHRPLVLDALCPPRYLVCEGIGDKVMRKLPSAILGGVLCLAAGSIAVIAQTPAEPQPMSFFLTSVGAGHGANFGGIAGADAHCQQLADAAGAGNRVWRAYLSNQARPGEPAIDARDRIGSGPWYNAHGVLVAADVEALHSENNNIVKDIALDENGETVGGRGDPVHEDDKTWAYMQAHPRSIRHEILTGSTPEGRAFTDGRDHTCNNWTSEEDGNSLERARFNTGPGAEIGKHDETGSWNSHGISGGCNHEGLARSHGAGLFYCFAID